MPGKDLDVRLDVGLGFLGSGFIADHYVSGLRFVPGARVVANAATGGERGAAAAHPVHAAHAPGGDALLHARAVIGQWRGIRDSHQPQPVAVRQGFQALPRRHRSVRLEDDPGQAAVLHDRLQLAALRAAAHRRDADAKAFGRLGHAQHRTVGR